MRFRYTLMDGLGNEHDHEYPTPTEAIHTAGILHRDVIERRYERDNDMQWRLAESRRIWTCDHGGAYV